MDDAKLMWNVSRFLSEHTKTIQQRTYRWFNYKRRKIWKQRVDSWQLTGRKKRKSKKSEKGGWKKKRSWRDDVQMQLKLGGVDYVQVNSPNGSILRPTGAEGGRLGPSIIGGGEGCPPLTGEGAYESPVVIKPSFYYSKKETLNRSVLWWRGRRPGLSSSQVSVKVKKKKIQTDKTEKSWSCRTIREVCGSLTLTRTCRLSRVWPEQRSPTLIQLWVHQSQPVGGAKKY